MAKLNTVTMRTDPELKKIIDSVLSKKSRKIKTPRITKAIANQYRKYPQLLKELLEAEMK